MKRSIASQLRSTSQAARKSTNPNAAVLKTSVASRGSIGGVAFAETRRSESTRDSGQTRDRVVADRVDGARDVAEQSSEATMSQSRVRDVQAKRIIRISGASQRLYALRESYESCAARALAVSS